MCRPGRWKPQRTVPRTPAGATRAAAIATRREHAIQKSLASSPSGLTQRPTDANAKSEIHPVTVRDSGRAKLCAGQVWREIRTNEASSWHHDHRRPTKIKDRERAFLLDGCSHRQRDWQARGHFRDFCLQIVPRSYAHCHRGARKGLHHVF